MPDIEYILTFTLPDTYKEVRLDKMIASHQEGAGGHILSRSRIQSLIENGQAQVNDKIIQTCSFKVKGGDTIHVQIPPAVDDTPYPENIPLDILHEDDDVIVLNKPAGMVVHPAPGNRSGTLVNALLYHCGDSLSGIGGVKRPGIVHRLDKDTSGLMVVAKHDAAHHKLSDQLQDRTLFRLYHALVWRVPTIIKGHVDAPIGRHQNNRLKMAVQKKSGRSAKTQYHMLESYGDVASLFECKLESGRTHQIRVHMQFIKHPVIGDPLYGMPEQEAASLLNKGQYTAKNMAYIQQYRHQALHAHDIGFIHPKTGSDMRFSKPIPETMESLRKHLKSVY